MKAAVITLWHPGDPWRERLWRLCRARWEAFGLDVVEGHDPRGLWAGRNAGARKAGAWDAAIFADADIALEAPEQAWAALARAAEEDTYVAAYDELVLLSKRGTEQAVAGACEIGDAERAGGWVDVWIGVFAIGRPLWDDLGGYDERFAPHPGQDIALIEAAATLGMVERVPGAAFHLWHEPRPPGGPRKPSPARDGLWGRYSAAAGSPELMRELLER